MPWARIDDNFFSHPKARKAWREPRALGLHMLALSYCMAHGGKDGVIDQEFVEDQIPDDGERSNVTAALVRAGLWRDSDHGWEIHDFLEYNPSKADNEARRKAERDRKRDARRE
jgi:hypothetical protein